MNELNVLRNRRKINDLMTICFDGSGDSVVEVIGTFSSSSSSSEVVLDGLSFSFTYNINQSISIPKL
jgi:hypothetical protein